jgi:uncharacterized sodium:solute symporter family permease YidK
MATTLVAIGYPVEIATVVGFGLIASFLAWLQSRRDSTKDSVEFFLTARNSVGPLTLAWYVTC